MTQLLSQINYSERHARSSGLARRPYISSRLRVLVAFFCGYGELIWRWPTAGSGRAQRLLSVLADRSQHRAPSIPDLVIAAAAELSGLTVLHLDKDFDLIADVTGQPVERLRTS